MSFLDFSVPGKLFNILKKRKRYKIIVGGRGSGKSETTAAILLFFVATRQWKVMSMREYQASIEDSSYPLFLKQIDEIAIPGFHSTKTEISHHYGGGFKFKGIAKNIESIKSAFDFNAFFIEEAQFLSDPSIQIITPTLRKNNSEIWLVLNALSDQDPVSVRFLNPYWDELITKGFYEDDMHLVIKLDYKDNPFFPEVLKEERLNDKKILTVPEYDHIWEGHFNDAVEGGLIQRTWFDACIDAHKVLRFNPEGYRLASHDPADEGADPKAFAFRHGVVISDLDVTKKGNINQGADWAMSLALKNGATLFTWDGDVIGAGLTRQFAVDLKPYGMHSFMFKGSERVDNPEAVYDGGSRDAVTGQKLNKDMFKNKRVQYYWALRDRIFKTYQAVTKNARVDSDELISFTSGMPLLTQLRSELCRIPIKPSGSGKIDLYTKKEMRDKFKIKSPNLADAVMMCMRTPPIYEIPGTHCLRSKQIMRS